MKKVKQPGENISLKTKKTEDPLVMQWLNTQSNLMDSLRYLMEKEISEHGVRNLQAYIPMERNMLNSESESAGTVKVVTPLANGPVSAKGAQLETAATTERGGNASSAAASLAAEALLEAAAAEEIEEEELDDEDIEAWI